MLTLYANRGGLEHIDDDVAKTGPDNVAIVLCLNWLSQIFGIVGVAAGRVSVSALLLGMIKSTELRWQRMFLWLVPITLAALIAMSCLTLASAQCSPTNALWDKRVQGKCIDPKVIAGFGTFTGGTWRGKHQNTMDKCREPVPRLASEVNVFDYTGSRHQHEQNQTNMSSPP